MKPGRSGPAAKKVKRLDRFGTHRAFVQDHVGRLTRQEGTAFPALALLVIWDIADGRDGKVRFLSVMRLAGLMGCDRKTAREALKVLMDENLLRCEEAGEGRRLPVYELMHCEKTGGDDDA